MNKELLNTVKSHFENHPYTYEKFLTHDKTNLVLIDELKDSKADLILDVGCGVNPFKQHVPNVIGIDVAYYEEADLCMSIEEAHKHVFKKNSVDVLLALGSINFGDFDNIKKQIGLMIDLVKPGGKMIMRGRGLKSRNNLNLRQYRHHQWSLFNVYDVHDTYSHKVEWIHEPIVETAKSGKNGAPGTPDPDRDMELFVWRWRKRKSVWPISF